MQPHKKLVLDRYQVKATFLERGRNIEKHPEIVKMIVARGDELANHSYSHKSQLPSRSGCNIL
ncbi:polysaccharide deacetylase family protein [Microcoleus vaginatus]|uniref:polysaccharide deacetylase family protein n=1 Tax=Microcoleus vaginatus TaxID=119532 RepID=UPI0032AAFAD6